jgi:hypothetical protein
MKCRDAEGAAQLDELPLAPALGERRHQQGQQQQVEGPLAKVMGQPLDRIPPQQPGWYGIAQPE